VTEQEQVVGPRAGERKRPGAGFEIGSAVEIARREHAFAANDRDPVPLVRSSTTQAFGPQEAAGRVQLRDVRVVTAGADERECARTWIEIGDAGEVPGAEHAPVGSHSDPPRVVVARPSQPPGPHVIAGRVQLRHERVVAAGTRQRRGARAGVEICRQEEIARRMHRPVGGNGDAAAFIRAGASHALGPHKVAGRIQFGDEYVRAAGAGAGGRPRAGIEIGGANVVAGRKRASVRGDDDGVAVIAAGAAHALGPDEIAGRVQLPDENVRAAGAGERGRARARIEIGRAGEVSRCVHTPVRGNGDAAAFIAAGASHALGPNEVARRIQLGDEHVVIADAAQPKLIRAGVEVRRAAVVSGRDDTAIRRDGDAGPILAAPSAHAPRPHQRSTDRILGNEHVAGSGSRQDPLARPGIKVDVPFEIPRHIDAAGRIRRHRPSLIIARRPTAQGEPEIRRGTHHPDVVRRIGLPRIQRELSRHAPRVRIAVQGVVFARVGGGKGVSHGRPDGEVVAQPRQQVSERVVPLNVRDRQTAGHVVVCRENFNHRPVDPRLARVLQSVAVQILPHAITHGGRLTEI